MILRKASIQKQYVQHYKEKSDIFDGELRMAEFLKTKTQIKNILDVGVGGGRTTLLFSGLSEHYTGLDFEPEMIKVCEEKFGDEVLKNKMSFKVGDASNMNIFEDETFDVVIFPFNGIDYLYEAGRVSILKECHRVLKPGGFFCFSFHNIFHIMEQYGKQPYRGVKGFLLEMYRRVFIRLKNGFNPKKIVSKKYQMFFDGHNYFTLILMYANPEWQINQLEQNGFKTIDFFNYKTGSTSAVVGHNDHSDSIHIPWFGLITQKV